MMGLSSLWSTPVLYKFVLEAETGPGGTSIWYEGMKARVCQEMALSLHG